MFTKRFILSWQSVYRSPYPWRCKLNFEGKKKRPPNQLITGPSHREPPKEIIHLSGPGSLLTISLLFKEYVSGLINFMSIWRTLCARKWKLRWGDPKFYRCSSRRVRGIDRIIFPYVEKQETFFRGVTPETLNFNGNQSKWVKRSFCVQDPGTKNMYFIRRQGVPSQDLGNLSFLCTIRQKVLGMDGLRRMTWVRPKKWSR